MLDLGSTIQEGVLYSVGVTGSFCDCAGNALAASTVIPFALPVKAGAQDIVINEILFDPGKAAMTLWKSITVHSRW
jgi:hypothetical protein